MINHVGPKVGDVVIITVNHPVGVSLNVSGRVGVIVCAEYIFDKEIIEYTIRDEFRDEYTYTRNEFEFASGASIAKAFGKVIGVGDIAEAYI